MVVFRNAIVRPPGPNFALGLSSGELGVPILAKALDQHGRYCEALQQRGLTLTRMNADPDHPDSTFVEDTAILTLRAAILARPGAASREGEVPSVREALAPFYPTLRAITPPGTLDGGDVCQAGDHFFVGISRRTNENGARQLADFLAQDGYSSTLVDIRGVRGVLHLKSGVAHLGRNRLVVIDALAGHTALRGHELVRVDAAESHAANCVRVNDAVLVAAGCPLFEAKLRSFGHEVVALEISEFRKMDGGLSCLSLRF